MVNNEDTFTLIYIARLRHNNTNCIEIKLNRLLSSFNFMDKTHLNSSWVFCPYISWYDFYFLGWIFILKGVIGKCWKRTLLCVKLEWIYGFLLLSNDILMNVKNIFRFLLLFLCEFVYNLQFEVSEHKWVNSNYIQYGVNSLMLECFQLVYCICNN